MQQLIIYALKYAFAHRYGAVVLVVGYWAWLRAVACVYNYVFRVLLVFICRCVKNRQKQDRGGMRGR